MNLTASLNMYAWPEVHSSVDGFWRMFQTQLKNSGFELPAKLNHDELARQSDSRNELLEFQGSTVAVNGFNSQSGYNALRNLLVERQCIGKNKPVFFGKGEISGGHRQSMQCVAAGKADICTADPVSFALAQQYEPAAKNLKVIDCTASTPGLPLICSATVFSDTEQLSQYQQAVHDAWQLASASDEAAPLMLDGITHVPRAAYSAVARHELSLFGEEQ